MAEFILGIDAGGTSVKAAIYSLDGAELGATSQPLRPIAPAPGFSERDPDKLWEGMCAVIRGALAKSGVVAADVASVGITGYGNGLYLLDAKGRPTTNGVLSFDLRAASMVEEWRAAGIESDYVPLTYKPLLPAAPAPLLAWFRRHRPEVLANAHTALTCKDYLRYRLTGRIVAEVTDQGTSALLPGAARARDPRILALFGVEDCASLFPAAIEPTEMAGAITEEAAAATGLRAGTPVPAGCCDNLAIMFGTGALENGRMVILSGTWGIHQVFLDFAIKDGSAGYVCHGLTPAQWLYCEGSPTSASSFEWFVDSFVRRPGADEPPEAAYALCNEAIARTRPDEAGAYFLPFLNGAPDEPKARGALIGLATWQHLGHAVRAVYEGVAFEHRRHFERLLRVAPRPARALFAGGAARSEAWSEIFAAALDLALDIPGGSEFGARGVAILAATVCGRFPDLATAIARMTGPDRSIAPDARLRDLLAGRYRTYLELREALRPHWGALAV